MKPAIMSDAKPETTSEAPTYIVTTGATSETKPQRGNVQKKYIIIGISAVLVVGLIIAGILIGVHIFAEAQKEIVKFSFQFKGSQNNDIKQDVEADPNDNVVMYHITQSEQDAYIVNDFNKGIQTIKITAKGLTKCFVRPLNVSEAMDPSKIIDAKSMTGSQNQEGSSMPFQVSSDPVVDRSFLTKKAKDMCSGVDLHWAYRKCKDSTFLPVNQTESGLSKRALYYMAPKYGMGGIGGCCWAYWACYVEMTEYIDGTQHHCQTYFETTWCCYNNPVYIPPIPRPYCENLYYAYWQTPGLYCPGP